jgi:hypothetical protein
MNRLAWPSGRGWGAPAAIVLSCLMAVACTAPITTRTTFPPFGSTPAPAGDATAATRQQVIGALAAVGLQAVDASRPYRPAEGPLLTAAPRTVLQALPDDAERGFIVIYALGSDSVAQKAAADHAAYLAMNTTKANLPPGSRFVLRRVGPTVVYFTWSAADLSDPRMGTIAEALATRGTEVVIPS